MTSTLLVIIGLTVPFLLVVLSVVGIYNRLIALLNRFKNAYAQIDVQLKRRYDLIPNLVETARAYLVHERHTLESIITARNAASSANVLAAANPGNPEAMQRLNTAEGFLTGNLGRLVALSEAYPDLKANATMLRLMRELTSTEDLVAFSRQSYNDAVMNYNARRGIFPSNAIASICHFTVAESFTIDRPGEREAPTVVMTR
jgi:LemA protein